MKPVTRTQEVTLYICETCGKEHPAPYLARRCEDEHTKAKCQHLETQIETIAGDEGSGRVYFNKTCKACRTTIATREISENMDEGDNQRIWDALETLDWPHQEVVDSYAARYGCTGIHLMVKIIQENQLLGKAIDTLPQSYRDDITDFLGENHGKDTVQSQGPQPPTPAA